MGIADLFGAFNFLVDGFNFFKDKTLGIFYFFLFLTILFYFIKTKLAIAVLDDKIAKFTNKLDHLENTLTLFLNNLKKAQTLELELLALSKDKGKGKGKGKGKKKIEGKN